MDLRNALVKNKNIYFAEFIKGIDIILQRPLKDVYGDRDKYTEDFHALSVEFAKARNKIFHGQITKDGLSREDLIQMAMRIRFWCRNFAEKLEVEIGYSGFSDSFQKAKLTLQLNNLDKFDTITKYEAFLKDLSKKVKIGESTPKSTL